MKGYIVGVAALSMLASAQTASADGFLFAATDHEEFSGDFAATGVDGLFSATTSGPTVTSSSIITTDYPINGLGEGSDVFLFAGQPRTEGAFPGNTLRRIDFDGGIITSVLGGFSAECCNEEMVLFDGFLYHAHFSTNIQRLDPVTGAVLETFAQSDVVGMAVINGDIWITKWGGKQVGIWEPAANAFIFKFSTNTATFNFSNAGALAWDPTSEVLWLGLQGGNVIPVDLAGTPLGLAVQPFGPISETIDGLAFVAAPPPAELAECSWDTPTLIANCDASGGGFAIRHKVAGAGSLPEDCLCPAIGEQPAVVSLPCIDDPGSTDACFDPATDFITTPSGETIVHVIGPPGESHISTTYCYAIGKIRICQTYDVPH